MSRRSPLGLLAVMLAFIAAACGGGGATGTDSPSENRELESFSFVASTDVSVGDNRFLLALRDMNGAPLGSPSEPLTMRYFPEDDAGAGDEAAGTFVWIVPDVTGLYRANLTFDRPGIWTVEASLAGTDVPPSSFIVKEVGDTPAVGEVAPASVTPTGSDFTLSEITTDPNPDPAFYELSVDEALASGRPSVIVFSTPAFCVTQACGPMLDLMKELRDAWPGVNWLHVEVFENIQDPEKRRYAPAVVEWNLPTEPWIFITDSDGLVAASFEGVVDVSEVTNVLTKLA